MVRDSFCTEAIWAAILFFTALISAHLESQSVSSNKIIQQATNVIKAQAPIMKFGLPPMAWTLPVSWVLPLPIWDANNHLSATTTATPITCSPKPLAYAPTKTTNGTYFYSSLFIYMSQWGWLCSISQSRQWRVHLFQQKHWRCSCCVWIPSYCRN